MSMLGGILNPGGLAPLTNASVTSGNIGSGQVTTFHVCSGGLLSGALGSGQVGRNHLSSGCVIDYFACEMALSGLRALAWGSGGCFVVAADRSSGLRLPCIGVSLGNFASGDVVPVIRQGRVGVAFSGGVASGVGGFLYVGSGGLVINQSGFMGGASSGQGAAPTAAGSGYSGAMVQRIAVAISGGLDVDLDRQATSGLFSGLLGAF